MLDIPYELKEPSEERELIHAASQQQIPSLPMNLMEQESTVTNEHTPERKSLLKKKTVKRYK